MPSIQCRFIDDVAWKHAPASFILTKSVHVWRVQLSANAHLANSLFTYLSADEVVRANSYILEKDRQRFILSRGMLRSILAKYHGEPAENIRFTVGENKKPFMLSNDTSLHYNVTHSGDWLLIAVSSSLVGIDVEYINTSLDYTEILPVCFSSYEIDYIQDRDTFYRLWTRKESLVKATGKGIDDDMPFVPCMDGLHEALAEKIGSDKSWTVCGFETSGQYTGSIAYCPPAQNILFFDAAML